MCLMNPDLPWLSVNVSVCANSMVGQVFVVLIISLITPWTVGWPWDCSSTVSLVYKQLRIPILKSEIQSAPESPS